MDLKCEGQPDVGIDTLQWIHTYKTAALLKAAVCCGATLAGASDEDLARCETYANKIGLAFQVRDCARLDEIARDWTRSDELTRGRPLIMNTQ